VCNNGTCSACYTASDCSTKTCNTVSCSSGSCKYDATSSNGKSCGSGNVCNNGNCSACYTASDCDAQTCRKATCGSDGVCSYPKVSAGTSCNSSGGTCNSNGSCVNEPYPECSVSGQECPFSSTKRGFCTSFGYCTVSCNSKADCPQVTNATVTCSYTCGMSCSGGSCPIGMLCSSSGECYWKMLN
jgi:hypothetical protein